MTRATAVSVAVLTAVAVLLAGCTPPKTRWVSASSGTVAQPDNPPPGALASWRPCPELARSLLQRPPANVTFECATVKVPQNWATAKDGQPSDGKTFDIALVRTRAAGQQNRIGSLLVNPGGPGGSGVELAVYLSAGLPVEVTRRFDIIGFDPRGVGRSSRVKCFTDADLDEYFGSEPDPVSQADFDKAVGLARRMAQACGTAYGDSLPLFSTTQAAQDMDAIRAAVGDQKLTYLGYSYGTLLGAVYAEHFPTSIRALVLDGAVDPTQSSVAASESQAKGFELAFSNFVTWCDATPAQCPIGPDPRAKVNELMQQARTAPVSGGGAGNRKVTSGWLLTAVVSSLYSQDSWRRLATALDSLQDGSATGVLALADQYAERDTSGKYSNLFDANSAVNCADDDDTPTVEQIRELQGQWRVKYPLFGATLSLNLICAQWPGKRDPYKAEPIKDAPAVMVVGTTGDPATPYEQTGKLAGIFSAGNVLTWQGEGHTAYPQTRCITNAVNSYLVDLKVPTPALTCPPE